MLKETYFAIVPRVKKDHPEAMFYAVALKMPFFVDRTLFKEQVLLLAPTADLLYEYKNEEKKRGNVAAFEFTRYRERFRKQILENPASLEKLRQIFYESQTKEVYLVCWEKNPPCHRFLLLEIVSEKQADWLKTRPKTF